jgi:hypothetical protein
MSGMGGPTGSICYRLYSSRDYVTTQAPSLRQSRDTFGGHPIKYELQSLTHTSIESTGCTLTAMSSTPYF